MNEKEIINTLSKAYFSDNPHEREVMALMPRLLRGVKLFVDVGASLGQFTKAASQCLRGGRIVAVEADPLRARELERSCKEWAAASGNSIQAVHGAASNESGIIMFQITNSSVSGGLFKHGLDHLSEESRRNVITPAV
ncbi:MAG: FkbM family methyltransferase [Verrucomicrobiota bacterium]|jgi:FkbM family methyltransferase